jgi:hypothetical protein
LDILIVSDKEIDIEIIHTFSLQMDCVYKVEYVISLIQLIMGDNLDQEIKQTLEK